MSDAGDETKGDETRGDETKQESAEIPARLDDGSAPETPEGVVARLESLGIATRTVTHPPLFTVEQSKELRGVLPGLHVKNLFLRNKKGDMWLVTCLEDRDVDLKRLGQVLEAGRFSFGSPDRLMRYLGVRPGAVTPLAVVNDRGGQVRMVLDAPLAAAVPVNVHPLVNDRTTALEGTALVRFLESTGHAPQLLDLGEIAQR